MSPMSAEATVVRNYLDWLLSLPWGKKTKVKKDIAAAEKVLNDDHYGLEKVKERILEYLAVQQRVGKMKGPILCLVGSAGRRQDLARQIHRQGDGPRIRAHVAWAACATRRKSAVTGAPISARCRARSSSR